MARKPFWRRDTDADFDRTTDDGRLKSGWFGQRYPVLGMLYRFVTFILVDCAFWIITLAVLTAVSALVVGIDETVRSIEGFIWAVTILWDLSAAHVDVLFVAGSLLYVLWLAQYVEMLVPDRDRIDYESGVLANHVALGAWTLIATLLGGAAALTTAAATTSLLPTAATDVTTRLTTYLSPTGWFAVYWMAAYHVAKYTNLTLRWDADHSLFNPLRTLWRWGTRVPLAYALYIAAGGPLLEWAPPEASVAFVLSVPLWGAGYLVRRYIGNARRDPGGLHGTYRKRDHSSPSHTRSTDSQQPPLGDTSSSTSSSWTESFPFTSGSESGAATVDDGGSSEEATAADAESTLGDESSGGNAGAAGDDGFRARVWSWWASSTGNGVQEADAESEWKYE